MNQAIQSVLFVDDEPHILNTMRWLFKRQYNVLVADSGAKAIEILKQQKVDVIVSDQKMPGMTGVEVLHQAKKLCPASMRILLTGYSDFDATVGSVNKGEIFRFVQKPWVNKELKEVVNLAADTASHTASDIIKSLKTIPGANTDLNEEKIDVDGPAVLVLDGDRESSVHIRDSLINRSQVFYTHNMEEALNLLEKENIGVIVSETQIGRNDVTSMIKLLKHYHPDIVSIVMTSSSDATTVIDLINEGQIFRFLTKPVKHGMCRLCIEAGLRKHKELKANPNLTKRHIVDKHTLAASITGVTERPSDEPHETMQTTSTGGGFFSSMINRIRGLRSSHAS